MINELVIAIVLTIGISALCSTLEALILSVTSAEIACLRQMSKSNDVGVDFIVSTTKVITGENLLRNINQKEDLGIYDESDGDRGVPWSIFGNMNLAKQ